MSCIVRVAIACPLRQLFDYSSPLSAEAWSPGVRVRVSFGHREVIGWVLGVETAENAHDRILKPILERIDSVPILEKKTLELISWVSAYYHHPIGETLQACLPKSIRQGETLSIFRERIWQLDQAYAPRGGKQAQLLAALQHGPCEESVLKQQGIGRTTLQAMAEKHAIKTVDNLPAQILPAPRTILLNDEQKHAVACIQAQTSFGVFVLQGITGSGKTEVYIEAVRQVLTQGKQALVLVPEIGLTPQFIARFAQALQVPIAVLHSEIAEKSKSQSWMKAHSGEAGVVIGTRSAVFVPMPHLALVVLDEEHDLSYKQQEGLRYHAKQIALVRAQKLGIPIVLGSATPALSTLHHVQLGNYQALQLHHRATGAALPTVRLIDTRSLAANHVIAPTVEQAIATHLAQGQSVLVFINRRGFAPVLMCHQCLWQASCRHCDAKMVMHRQKNVLICHHCGAMSKLPPDCPSCQHADLQHYGAGTEQLEHLLKQRFPAVSVVRIDRETTQRKHGMQRLLSDPELAGPRVLVGTQMLAKGHDLHDITLVVVIDADQGLFSADFAATELLAALITQVIGRAGRGQKAGEVLIQTRHTEHEFWQSLLSHDYPALAQRLLNERQQFHLPPYQHWVVVRAEAKTLELARQLLSDTAQHLAQKTETDVAVMGPVAPILERKSGRYRQQLLLASAQRSQLHRKLDHLIAFLESHALAKKCRWSLDVDPVSLIT